uniref:Uncharacterized protein n=1 Tax=Lepeophtheirus salmonis TaxID=72036 RepID=A0A0K2U859_LEPSM
MKERKKIQQVDIIIVDKRVGHPKNKYDVVTYSSIIMLNPHSFFLFILTNKKNPKITVCCSLLLVIFAQVKETGCSKTVGFEGELLLLVSRGEEQQNTTNIIYGRT